VNAGLNSTTSVRRIGGEHELVHRVGTQLVLSLNFGDRKP